MKVVKVKASIFAMLRDDTSSATEASIDIDNDVELTLTMICVFRFVKIMKLGRQRQRQTQGNWITMIQVVNRCGIDWNGINRQPVG